MRARFRRREMSHLAPEHVQLLLEGLRGQCRRPDQADAFARNAGAQVGIALAGEALFGPGDAETVVTGALGATGDYDTVGQIPAEDEIDERRRRHRDTGQGDDPAHMAGASTALAGE